MPAIERLSVGGGLLPVRVGVAFAASLLFYFIGLIFAPFAIWTTYQLKLLADDIGTDAAG